MSKQRVDPLVSKMLERQKDHSPGRNHFTSNTSKKSIDFNIDVEFNEGSAIAQRNKQLRKSISSKEILPMISQKRSKYKSPSNDSADLIQIMDAIEDSDINISQTPINAPQSFTNDHKNASTPMITEPNDDYMPYQENKSSIASHRVGSVALRNSIIESRSPKKQSYSRIESNSFNLLNSGRVVGRTPTISRAMDRSVVLSMKTGKSKSTVNEASMNKKLVQARGKEMDLTELIGRLESNNKR